jgi:hypothetical protein
MRANGPIATGATLLVSLLLALAGPAGADVLQDLGATFQQVAQELAAAFPKVEARVVLVRGGQVEIEGPEVQALRPGLELQAYRKGEVFRHPITNQPLGRGEEEVATLVVTSVSAPRAGTRILPGGGSPVEGDGARLSAGRLPVAVLPPTGVTAALEAPEQVALLLVARFSALLERTGRFLPLEARRVLEATGQAAAPGSAVDPAPTAVEAARRLGVPAVLTSRLVGEGRLRYLETAWVSGRSGETLVATRTPLVRASLAPRFAWEQTPEVQRRIALDSALRGLALADLDGDGRGELVVGDEQLVTVYRWPASGRPTALAGATFRPGGLILSVDAGPVNGTDRAQVVVVAHAGGSRETIRSWVLELGEGGLRPIHSAWGSFLRVIRVERESWLVEQDAGEPDRDAAGSDGPYAAGVRRLVWQAGRYRAGPTLRTPNGVSVYGLALMRLSGGPEPDIVALTPEDRLAVWNARGQRLWTSADPYGGAPIAFPYDPPAQGLDRDPVIGRVPGRVISVAADAQGGPELLVFENLLPVGGAARTILPRTAPSLFTQGRIHRLRWQDGTFLRVWQSATTEGYIVDFAYGDADGDGAPEVLVGVAPRGLNVDTLSPFSRARAHLVLYELP